MTGHKGRERVVHHTSGKEMLFHICPGPDIQQGEEMGIVVDVRIPYRRGHGQAVEGKALRNSSSSPV